MEKETHLLVNSTHELVLKLHDEYYDHIRPTSDTKDVIPPIILESHLMYRTNTPQKLRSEIDMLIKSHVIRQFSLDIGEFVGERYFMLESEYKKHLLDLKSPAVDKFVEIILPHLFPTVISRKALVTKGFSSEEISELLASHCLLLKPNEMFTINVPKSGPALSSIKAGRRALVKYLQTHPRKIADKSEVERRAVQDSIYYSTFHTDSLLGLGVLETVELKGREAQLRVAFNPYKAP